MLFFLVGQFGRGKDAADVVVALLLLLPRHILFISTTKVPIIRGNLLF